MSVPREVLLERKRYKEWIEYFKPTMVFNASGEQVKAYEVTEESRKELAGVDPNLLWSEVHSDDGSMLVSGFWDHDEVLYWFVTERPWTGRPASFSIEMAVRVDCKICDGSGETASGNSCSKCDGDGYKIYDVD
jgi:hypothetical protein